jgi:O-antigen ligase
VASAITYLVFLGGSFAGIYFTALRTTSLVIVGLGLAIWCVQLMRNRTLPSSAMWPAIAAAVVSMLVSTFFSRYPGVSIDYLAYAVILVALYLIFVELLRTRFYRDRITAILAMMFFVTAVVYVGQTVWKWVDWWTRLGRFTTPPLRPDFSGLTYGNPSAVFTIVMLLAVPTLVAPSGGRLRKIITAAVSVVAAVVGILTGSRAGWIAVAGTAAIVAVIWLLNGQHREALRTRVWSWIAQLPRWQAVIGGLVLVAVAVGIGPAMVRRALEPGVDARTTYSVVALRMFSESPIVGTGLGSWVIQRVAYTDAPDRNIYVPHAHNIETQTLAEQGLVGAIAGLILLATIVMLFRRAAADQDPSRRRMAWIGGASVLYFFLHNQLDFYPNFPGVLFLAAYPIAWLDATHGRGQAFVVPRLSEMRTRPPAMATALGLTALLALSVGWSLAREIPAMTMGQAVSDANDGHWEAAYPLASEAAAAEPDDLSYQMTRGLAALHAGDNQAAIDAFTLVARKTDLPEAWLNLARAQANVGESAVAITSLQSAMRLGYQQPAIAMPVGELAKQLRDHALAVDGFSAAIAAVPSVAADPWWMSDADRAAAYPEVIAAAISRAPVDVRWEIALMSGQVPLSTSLASMSDDPPWSTLVIAAWGGDGTARTTMVESCRDQPFEIYHLEWCARIEDRAGDGPTAGKFRLVANTIEVGSFEYAAELRVAAAGTDDNSLAGDPSLIWGAYTYRESTPQNVIGPGLIHLAIQ